LGALSSLVFRGEILPLLTEGRVITLVTI
jgi:hypothetical protein